MTLSNMCVHMHVCVCFFLVHSKDSIRVIYKYHKHYSYYLQNPIHHIEEDTQQLRG